MSKLRGRRYQLAGLGTIAAFILAVTALAADSGAPLELKQTIESKGKSGKLDHAALDAKRGRLLMANKVNNTVDILDLKESKLLRQIPNQSGAQGIAVAADLDRVYVALGTGGFCNMFDGQDYKLLKTHKFADDADNVRYDPRTHLVYVAHAEKSLGVLDGKTLELRADVKLPGMPEGFEVEKARPRMYLNIPTPPQVVVLDTDKNEVVTQYPVKLASNPVPLGLDEANHRLFLGCRKAPMIVVMDSESGKEITSVPIPSGVDDLFYDAQRKQIYASCGEGFLAVVRQVDADHYEPLAKLPTVKDAKTCYFDPDGSRLYLLVPRQPGKPGPEIRVYQVHP